MMMRSERTTLTLEADVAVELRRLRRTQDRSFKALVNDVLRLGLERLAEGTGRRRGAAIRTASADLGESLIALDDVAEALAIAEGEGFK